jgi:hypothetical protein
MIWVMSKRFYRFLANQRISHRDLLKGFYEIVRQTFAQYAPEYVVVALGPDNFEKPYPQGVVRLK